MGSIYASDAVKIANDWIGYKEGTNNWTKMAEVLDDCGYYSPMKKQNVAWCATFVNFCLLQAALPYDRSNESKKYDAQAYQFQPNKNNYSAGAKEHAGYFKSAGKFFTDHSKAQMGDIIYFNVSGSIGHVGIVEEVSANMITTIEGNAGDMVQRKWYDKGDKKIAGFGRPSYDGLYAPKTEKTEPVKTEDKKEGPKKASSFDDRMRPWTEVKVIADGGIPLRSAANQTSSVLITVPKGEVLKVSGFLGDYGFTSYGAYTGYVLCTLTTT